MKSGINVNARMIEIELFQREPSSGVHTAKIWINGYLSHANEICTVNEILGLRDALRNELQWLNDYLRQNAYYVNEMINYHAPGIKANTGAA